MWLTALLIGFAGSFHCLGMCSPLVMAVTTLRKPFFINRLMYNSGRIFMYGLLGALVSAFGSLFRLSGFQNILTVSLGSVLIILGLAGSSQFRIPLLSSVVLRITIRIKCLFSKFLQEKTTFSTTIMGMLNGLLPCGLTYLALTYCLTVANAANGFLFMMIFGVGTLPVMLGFTSVIHVLINRFNFTFRNLSTVVMIALGALLITRGIYVHYHENIHSQQEESIVPCKQSSIGS